MAENALKADSTLCLTLKYKDKDKDKYKYKGRKKKKTKTNTRSETYTKGNKGTIKKVPNSEIYFIHSKNNFK